MDKPRYPQSGVPPRMEPAEPQAVSPPPLGDENPPKLTLQNRLESITAKALDMLGQCSGGPLAIFNGLALTVMLMFLIWPYLQGPDRYDEPILGVNALIGASKLADMRAFILIVALGSTLTLVSGWIVRKLRGTGQDPARNRIANTILLLAAIPFWGWVSRSMMAPQDVGSPGLALAFVVIGFVLILALGRLPLTVDNTTLVRFGAMGLLTTLVSMLSGLGIATAVCRTHFGAVKLAGMIDWLPWATMTIGTLVFVVSLWSSSPADALNRHLRLVLLVAQLPLPLLYFSAVTPPTLSPTGESFNETSIRLPILITLIIAGSWVGWTKVFLRCLRAAPDLTAPLRRCLAPTALCAIAVFMSIAPATVPKLPSHGSMGSVPGGGIDDFHPAEYMLPWQQWRHFGKVPFVDQMPSMGWRAVLVGMLNDVFFDGTFIGTWAAENLLLAIGAAGLFAAAWWVVGPAAALAAAMCMLQEGRLLPFVPLALLLSAPAVYRRPLLWVCLWFGIGWILVLYNPSLGVLMLAGGFPVAVAFAWQAFKSNRKHFGMAVAITLAVAAGIWITPIGAIFKGAILFIRENSVGYIQSAGIPVQYSWNSPNPGSQPVGSSFGFELLRQSWVFMLPLGLAFLARELTAPKNQRRVGICLFILLVIPVLFLLSNWALVRVDPDTWSRPGLLSGLVVCQVLPMILLAQGRWWTGAVTVTVLAALAGALEMSPMLTGGMSAMNRRASVQRRFESAENIVRGAEIGMPSIGNCEGTREQIERYIKLNKSLAGLLGPDETFFDLSNRNNLYVYNNRPVPTPYPGPYYTPTLLMQKRMLDALRINPVPVAVLAPPMTMDGNISFRCYPVLRQFFLNYVAVNRESWVFLVDPKRAPEVGPIGSESQLQLLDAAFSTPNTNIQGAPIVWGKSWATMADRFTMMDDLTRSGTFQPSPPRMTYDISSRGIHGTGPDFLFLQFRLRKASEGPQSWMIVAWKPRGSTQIGQVYFAAPMKLLHEREASRVDPASTDSAEEITAVIPLGCWPRWLLSQNIDALTVGVTDAKSVTEFTVTKAQLMKLTLPVADAPR